MGRPGRRGGPRIRRRSCHLLVRRCCPRWTPLGSGRRPTRRSLRRRPDRCGTHAWRGLCGSGRDGGILAYDWFYVAPDTCLRVPRRREPRRTHRLLGCGRTDRPGRGDAVRRAKRSEGARTEIAAEQAALRRVATLVARGVPASDVFAAVAAESGQLLGVHSAHMARFDADGGAIGVSSWSPGETHIRPGRRIPLTIRASWGWS